jgi:alanine-glyoxylate transaminase/serine-glyoxylate transaminase/serine-pyruvate transaminase
LATNNVMALRQSLKNLLEEGIETRLERYRELALYLRQELRRIGYEPTTTDEEMAPVLTAAYGKPGVPTGKVVNYLEAEHGIKIAGGLGSKTADKIIRIGHMSPGISREDIDEVIGALEGFEG